MAFKSFKPDATDEEKAAYIKSCRWKLDVQRGPAAPIQHPHGGAEYNGQHVGELRAQHGNQMKVTSPAGAEEVVDLTPYADTDRIQVRWVNLDAPGPGDRGTPPPGWEPPPGMPIPPGWHRTPEGWRPSGS